MNASDNRVLECSIIVIADRGTFAEPSLCGPRI